VVLQNLQSWLSGAQSGGVPRPCIPFFFPPLFSWSKPEDEWLMFTPRCVAIVLLTDSLVFLPLVHTVYIPVDVHPILSFFFFLPLLTSLFLLLLFFFCWRFHPDEPRSITPREQIDFVVSETLPVSPSSIVPSPLLSFSLTAGTSSIKWAQLICLIRSGFLLLEQSPPHFMTFLRFPLGISFLFPCYRSL